MNTKIMITRRRKWKRYKIKGGAIVFIHKPRLIEIGKPKLIKLGPVIDISMGGLAVQFVKTKTRLTDSETVSISIPATSVNLGPLNYKIISERTIASLPNGKFIYNRCLEFTNLTSIQKLQLETFIRKHTFNILKDRRSGKDRRQLDSNIDYPDDRRSGLERRVYVR